MTFTTHLLAGAAIGKNINNFWLIAIFSLAIHYIMDGFRHGEYVHADAVDKNSYWKIALDVAIGLSVIFICIYFRQPDAATIQNMLAGVFFSIFPDIMSFLYCNLNFKFLKWQRDFHKKIHPHPMSSPGARWNLKNSINDIIFAALAIILLFI